MKHPFHSLLADFLKTAGLHMDLPSAGDLESFEFELDGMPCVVAKTAAASHPYLGYFRKALPRLLLIQSPKPTLNS